MSDQITYLPLSAIREHPDNPRKHWSRAELADLADSIKAQGVLQPVVVRPLLHDTHDSVRYELVFGHRRLRACASLPDYSDDGLGLRIPAIVRAMSDEQVALAQVAENLQRADVTPLEEADNLLRLHRQFGMAADTIAEQIGKSRSYVYGRLKLSRATDAVRDAINSEGLSPEIGLEVARLHAKLQPLGLKRVRAYAGEWVSFRSAKSMLRDTLEEHRIGNAAFDPADAALIQHAAACTHCPKRAGNDPDLVDAKVPADVCTDPECFAQKQRANTEKELPRLRALGVTVIDAAEAAEMQLFKGGHSNVAGYWHVDNACLVNGFDADDVYQNLSLQEALAALRAGGVVADAPQQVAIVNPHTGTHDQYITAQAAKALGDAWRNMMQCAKDAKAASTPATAARASSHEPPRRDPTADWTNAERVFADYTQARRVLRATFARMLARPRTVDDLRLILVAELHRVGVDEFDGPAFEHMGLNDEFRAADERAHNAGEDFDPTHWWIERLATLGADQLAQLLMGMALTDLLDNVYGGAPGARATAARAAAIAASYGVDVVAAAQPEQVAAPGSRDAPCHASVQVDALQEQAA